jgi:hypothetical protein
MQSGNNQYQYFGGSKGSHNRRNTLSTDIASIHILVRENDSRLLAVVFRGIKEQEIFKIGDENTEGG